MTGTSHQQLVGFIWSVADLKSTYTNLEPVLRRPAEQRCLNDSPLDFRGLLADPANVASERRQALISTALPVRST